MRAQLGAKSEKLQLQIADVLDEESVSALVERVTQERGRLDIALNLVGGYAAGQSITELPYDRWPRCYLNLRTAFLVSRCRAPMIHKNGDASSTSRRGLRLAVAVTLLPTQLPRVRSSRSPRRKLKSYTIRV